MKRFGSMIAAGLVVFLGQLLGSQPAQAQAPGVGMYHPYGIGYGYPYGFGFGSSPYSLSRVPTPPYFALHPPVYYSYAVPRTFGHSPFAYPGTYRTPEVDVPEPEVIDNPHVQLDPEHEGGPDVATGVMAVICNPFIPSADCPSSARYTVTDR